MIVPMIFLLVLKDNMLELQTLQEELTFLKRSLSSYQSAEGLCKGL